MFEAMIACRPFFRNGISLSFHASFREDDVIGNRDVEILENAHRCDFIVFSQFFIGDFKRLDSCCIEIVLPGPFVFHNLLPQVINGLEMKVQFLQTCYQGALHCTRTVQI